MSSAAWSTSAAPRGLAGSSEASRRRRTRRRGQSTPSPAATDATRHRLGSGEGIVRSRPDPAGEHDAAGDMPVSREIWAFQSSPESVPQCEPPPAVIGLEFLLRHGQVDGAAVQAARVRSVPSSGRRRRVLKPPASRLLNTDVVKLGSAADHGALYPYRGGAPSESRSIVHSTAGGLVGQQAGRSLGHAHRMQRHLAVGQVYGFASSQVSLSRHRRAGQTRLRRRWRRRPGSRRRDGAGYTAWSRSREVAGSIVTNGMSVRSTRAVTRPRP